MAPKECAPGWEMPTFLLADYVFATNSCNLGLAEIESEEQGEYRKCHPY